MSVYKTHKNVLSGIFAHIVAVPELKIRAELLLGYWIYINIVYDKYIVCRAFRAISNKDKHNKYAI